MFGYVNIYKDELKIKDYNLFRGYYCGLCKAQGKNFSQISRLGLSYDITFLSILMSAVTDEEIKVTKSRCFVHPTKKRAVVMSPSTQYAANVGIILSYLKFKDDFKDEKSIPAFIMTALYKRSVSKARKNYSYLYNIIEENLNKLSSLEKENCSDIDELADPFAKILSAVFTPDFCPESQKRQLSWLGYNIGRFIYIVDAIADREKDKKKNNFNPLLSKTNEEIKNIDFSLSFTLENVAKSYELLDIKRNDSILRNIIYDGLKNKQADILSGQVTTHKSSEKRTEKKNESI